MLRIFTINFFFVFALTVFFHHSLLAQQAQSYESTMQSGNERYDAGDFISAKTYFEMALRLKENDPKAQERLSASIKKINEQMEKQELFYSHLDRGDRLNREGNSTEALAAYRKALEIFPDDKYTNTQVNSISKLLTEKEKKQSDYDRALANGIQLVENEKFEEAIIQFKLAAGLFPDLDEPKQKIEDAQQLLSAQIEKEQQFRVLKEEASQLLLRRNYTAAIQKFEAALQIFPSDAPTLSQIAEARELKSKSEQYEILLAKADEAYQNKQLPEARKLYNDALSYWPQQTYPADMVRRIDDYFSSEEYLNTIALTQLLETAEIQYSSNEWLAARESYNKVLDIDPEHVLASERLTEITFILKQNEELALKESQYSQLLAEGDNFFSNNEYNNAIKSYTQASEIKQTDEIEAKIDLTNNKILELQLASEKEEQYRQYISQAENLLEQNELLTAKTTLEQAIALFPEKEEAIKLLQTTENNLAALQEKETALQAYTLQLQQAKAAFDAKNWELALQAYEVAISMQPDDAFPKEQIEAIKEIQRNETALAEMEAAYAEQLETGMNALAEGLLDKAQTAFEAAKELKPDANLPQEKLAEINVLKQQIATAAEKEATYNTLIAEGDAAFNNQNLTAALENFRLASGLFPERDYPTNKINEIETAINLAKTESLKRDTYAQLIQEADLALNAKEWSVAKEKYTQASDLFSEEVYPRQQISTIEAELNRQNELAAIEKNYQEKIAQADGLFNQQSWEQAMLAYQEAAAIKADDSYPNERMNEIRSIQQEEAAVAEKARQLDLLTSKMEDEFRSGKLDAALISAEEILKLDPENPAALARKSEIQLAIEALARENELQYQKSMQEGDASVQQKDYQEAIVSYKKALGYKAMDETAQQRIKQVEAIIEERLIALKTAYGKHISEADRHFNSGSYDLAIESYLKAEGTKPDESYPREMIRKIAELMEANKMRELISAPTQLTDNISKQFSFDPIDVVDRRSNYILIKARNLGETAFPLLVNFGSPTGRNGGFVLPIPQNQETNDFIVRIGSQYKWFSEDNTWIELLPENGSIEVTVIQISKGN